MTGGGQPPPPPLRMLHLVLVFVLPLLVSTQYNSPADVRAYCSYKVDGVYAAEPCVEFYHRCHDKKTSLIHCAKGLWFNPQSLQCDFKQNVIQCRKSNACAGRVDGAYAEGCSSMFWFCDSGEVNHSTCQAGLYFDVEQKRCEYKKRVRACGGDPSVPANSEVFPSEPVPTPAAYAPRFEETPRTPAVSGNTAVSVASQEARPEMEERQADGFFPTYPPMKIAGFVRSSSSSALHDSDAGSLCEGKRDGAHAVGECTSEYVLCWEGEGQRQQCQEGLRFNEGTGGCDYEDHVDGCTPFVGQDNVAEKVDLGGDIFHGGHVAPGREESPYGSLAQGAEIARDVAEESSFAFHQTGVDLQQDVLPVQSSQLPIPRAAPAEFAASSLPETIVSLIQQLPHPSFDCSLLPDAVYSSTSPSDGCSPFFFSCSAFLALQQRCPEGLLFNPASGVCDYPDSCGKKAVAVAEVDPSPPVTPQTEDHGFSCSGLPDGKYGLEECAEVFVECVHGTAWPLPCPPGLLFSKALNQCQDRQGCIQSSAEVEHLEAFPGAPYAPGMEPTEKREEYATTRKEQPSLAVIDCSSLADGLYSLADCSPTFVQCTRGEANPLECSSGQVFHQKRGFCEWREVCGCAELAVPAPPPSAGQVYPAICSGSFRKAIGNCTSKFVECQDGRQIARRCPGQSLFDESIGLCVYDLDGCGIYEGELMYEEQGQDSEVTSDHVYGGDRNEFSSTTTASPARSPLELSTVAPEVYAPQLEHVNPEAYHPQTEMAPRHGLAYLAELEDAIHHSYQPALEGELSDLSMSKPYRPANEDSSDKYEAENAHSTPLGSSSSAPKSPNGLGYQNTSSFAYKPSFSPPLACSPVGSRRAIRKCWPAYEECSATSAVFVKKFCKKTKRFDDEAKECRRIFRIRACEEPLASYLPPVLPTDEKTLHALPPPAVLVHKKTLLDDFRGGGRIREPLSNPFYARGRGRKIFFSDGFGWAPAFRTLRRHHKRVHHHRGGIYLDSDEFLVSGNVFKTSKHLPPHPLSDDWRGGGHLREALSNPFAPSQQRRHLIHHPVHDHHFHGLHQSIPAAVAAAPFVDSNAVPVSDHARFGIYGEADGHAMPHHGRKKLRPADMGRDDLYARKQQREEVEVTEDREEDETEEDDRKASETESIRIEDEPSKRKGEKEGTEYGRMQAEQEEDDDEQESEDVDPEDDRADYRRRDPIQDEDDENEEEMDENEEGEGEDRPEEYGRRDEEETEKQPKKEESEEDGDEEMEEDDVEDEAPETKEDTGESYGRVGEDEGSGLAAEGSGEEETIAVAGYPMKPKTRGRRSASGYRKRFQSRLSSHRILLRPGASLHRTPFRKICISRPAGRAVSVGQCRQDFVYCKKAARPIVAACPVGDLFDATLSSCVPTEQCGAEVSSQVISPHQAARLPYARQAPPPRQEFSSAFASSPLVPPYSPESVFAPPPRGHPVRPNHQRPEYGHHGKYQHVRHDASSLYDCSGKPNGGVSLGCATHFIVCSNGLSYLMDCPAGLFYDISTDACQWREETAECNGRPGIRVQHETRHDSSSSLGYHQREKSSSSQTTYEGLTSNSSLYDSASLLPSSTHPSLEVSDAPSPGAPRLRFSCPAQNGGFAMDCQGGFIMCREGNAELMQCPPELTFDEESQACQNPLHVLSCGGTAPDKPTEAVVDPRPTPEDLFSAPSSASIKDNVAHEGSHPSLHIHEEEQLLPHRPAVISSPRHSEPPAQTDKDQPLLTHHKVLPYTPLPIEQHHGFSYEARPDQPIRPEYIDIPPPLSTAREDVPYQPEFNSLDQQPTQSPGYQPQPMDSLSAEHAAVAPSPSPFPSSEWPSETYKPKAADETRDMYQRGDIEKEASLDQHQPDTSRYPYKPVPSLRPYEAMPYEPEEQKMDQDAVPSSSSKRPLAFSTAPQPPSYSTAQTASTVRSTDSHWTAEPVASADDASSSEPMPSVVGRDLTSPTESPLSTSTVQASSPSEQCAFVAEQPAYPLEYCAITYAVCHEDGTAFRVNCSGGFLFDSMLRHCVPAQECGKEYLKAVEIAKDGKEPPHSITQPPPVPTLSYKTKKPSSHSNQSLHKQPEAEKPVTGEEEKPSSAYKKEDAGHSDEYSRHESDEGYGNHPRRPPHPLRHPGGALDAEEFCATKKKDGLYRHPDNCAAIVQCFGGEMFAYPSCQSGLFFHEEKGECDYASAVEECATQRDPVAVDDDSSSCNGAEHGAHLADSSDCGIFYRCVWTRLEKLSCPEGTVFNPRLSVCDYPHEVPHCANYTGKPSSDSQDLHKVAPVYHALSY